MKKSEYNLKRFRKGVTLLELIVATAISVIPISTAGVLLVAGQTSVGKIHKVANSQIENEGQDATVVFGRIGRKSNLEDCKITIGGKPPKSTSGGRGSSTPNISGNTVNFGYNITSSQVPRRGSDRRGNRSSSSVNLKEYASFFLNGNDNTLRVAYSPEPPGSGSLITNTVILANNVTKVTFSRAIVNNIPQGCVRMKMTLQDPDNGRIFTVTAATLLRN